MESSKKNNREILDLIFTNLKTLQLDLNVVKTDIKYIKTILNCKSKIQEHKIVEPKEEVYQGWWWRS